MTHFTTSVPGQIIRDQLSAFEDDGKTKRSGLTLGGGDFIVTVWKDCVVDALPVVITEIGSSGEYCVEYAPPTAGYWEVQIHVVFSDDFFKSMASVAFSPDFATAIDMLQRVLGLLHMNAMVDKQLFDSADQLLSARLRVFNSTSNLPLVENGNETTGLIHEYAIEATWEGVNREAKYALRQVL